MLLTSRPARSPLAHLDRPRFTPSYDPNRSIRSRLPANVVTLRSPPSDVDPQAPPAPVPTPTQVTSPYNPYQPIHPSPLRFVTNAELTMANLGTLGGNMVVFPRTPRRNLSVPKRVRFKGVEIVIPPLPTSPAPTLATENIPVSTQDASLISSDYVRISPISFDHETPATDEFPDSPSVYSPTPPNSSTPPTTDPFESSRGGAKSVGDPFVEQPCGQDGSVSTSCGKAHIYNVYKKTAIDNDDDESQMRRKEMHPTVAAAIPSLTMRCPGGVVLTLQRAMLC